MTVHRIVLGTLLIAVVACDGATAPLNRFVSVVPESPSLALNPSYGLRDFEFTAFSYGPNFEEYDTGACLGTYDIVEDSVKVWSGVPPHYIKGEYYKRVGCQIGSPGGGPFVGGNITYQITNSGGASGSVLADGVEDRWLFDVPKDPGGTLLLNAYADYGYEFVHWIIYPSSGGTYYNSNASLNVPLNSTDYHFHAEFQKEEED